MNEELRPHVYVPYWQNAGQLDALYCVRVEGDPATMLPLLLREVNRVDPDVPVTETLKLAPSELCRYVRDEVFQARLGPSSTIEVHRSDQLLRELYAAESCRVAASNDGGRKYGLVEAPFAFPLSDSRSDPNDGVEGFRIGEIPTLDVGIGAGDDRSIPESRGHVSGDALASPGRTSCNLRPRRRPAGQVLEARPSPPHAGGVRAEEDSERRKVY